MIDLRLGDNIKLLKELEDNSVDSIVCDPPYGLSFMGKKWDYDVPSVELWKEVLRVLKPGGHLLAFAGTRTQHRMAVNIEDAGFEIRDMVAWIYGSGFPKSYNISKAIEATEKTGKSNPVALRKVEQEGDGEAYTLTGKNNGILGETRIYDRKEYTPGTENSKQWEGWGTALKPALEPITVARKPISEKTIAENVLKWGTGGINIDESRVPTDDDIGKRYDSDFQSGNSQFVSVTAKKDGKRIEIEKPQSLDLGRFPANLIHDGSDEVLELFPNNGSASRFFYCAKASKKERNEGLDGFADKIGGAMSGTADKSLLTGSGNERNNIMKNNHPTVKPIKLMEYLVKLVTPENAIVLDPFMGSGSTGIACVNLNRKFIGMELDKDYFKIAKARIEKQLNKSRNL